MEQREGTLLFPHRQLSVPHMYNSNSWRLTRPGGAACLTHRPNLLPGPGFWVFFETVLSQMYPKQCRVIFLYLKKKPFFFHSCQHRTALKIFLIKDDRDGWLKMVNKTEVEVFSSSVHIEYIYIHLGAKSEKYFETGIFFFTPNQTWVSLVYWNHSALYPSQSLSTSKSKVLSKFVVLSFVSVVLCTDNVEWL